MGQGARVERIVEVGIPLVIWHLARRGYFVPLFSSQTQQTVKEYTAASNTTSRSLNRVHTMQGYVFVQ